MVENYYEFIVTCGGRFFFSTSERSCPVSNPEKARDLYSELSERFPVSDGFKVLVHKITCYGETVTIGFAKHLI